MDHDEQVKRTKALYEHFGADGHDFTEETGITRLLKGEEIVAEGTLEELEGQLPAKDGDNTGSGATD